MQQRDMPPLEVPGAVKYGCLGAGSISVEVLGFLEGVRFKWGEDSVGLSGAQEETARFPLYAFLTRLPAQRSTDLLERLKKAFSTNSARRGLVASSGQEAECVSSVGRLQRLEDPHGVLDSVVATEPAAGTDTPRVY